jgi:hypothetical protein
LNAKARALASHEMTTDDMLVVYRHLLALK